MDEDLIQLEKQLNEAKELLTLKDEQIKRRDGKIQELEETIAGLSKTDVDERDQFIIQQLRADAEERQNIYKENEAIKANFLKVLLKKQKLKKLNKIIQMKTIPVSPKSPSGIEAENKKLLIQISSLETELTSKDEQIANAEEEIRIFKQKYEDIQKQKDELTLISAKNFDRLKEKLQAERELMKENNAGKILLEKEELEKQMDNMEQSYKNQIQELEEQSNNLQQQIDELQKSNKDLQEKVKSSNDAYQDLARTQSQFIESLGEYVGCHSLEEGLVKVKNLTNSPTNSFENIEILNRNASTNNDDVRAAIQQVLEQISPNQLKLPANSELRQLFAAMNNMLSACLKPKTNQNTLRPFILSVVHQAREITLIPHAQHAEDKSFVSSRVPPLDSKSETSRFLQMKSTD